MSIQAGAQGGALGSRGARAGEHDEIERREGLLAERFAGEPLEQVAIHGALRRSPRDG